MGYIAWLAGLSLAGIVAIVWVAYAEGMTPALSLALGVAVVLLGGAVGYGAFWLALFFREVAERTERQGLATGAATLERTGRQNVAAGAAMLKRTERQNVAAAAGLAESSEAERDAVAKVWGGGDDMSEASDAAADKKANKDAAKQSAAQGAAEDKQARQDAYAESKGYAPAEEEESE
jgi:hypothetical protein